MELIKVFSLIGIGLFCLFGIYLIFSQYRRSLSNTLIGLFFILFGINLFDGWLMLEGIYLQHAEWAVWEDPFVLMYGPLIYFYTKSLTTEKLTWKNSYLIHLLPFLIFFLLTLFVYHLRSFEFKQSVITAAYNFEQQAEVFIPVVLLFTHVFIYIFYAKKLIHRYHEQLSQFYSNFNTTWLKKVLNNLMLILLIAFINSIIQYFGSQEYFIWGLMIESIFLLIFISYIYFNVLEEPHLFTKNMPVSKYSSKLLDDNERMAVREQIKSALEIEKAYLDSGLTVDDLSKFTNISARKLSSVINDVYKCSFFELINSYRIEEAKRIMVENEDPKLTVLEVLYNSGFNSKSSFNTQFKKRTGLTPSEFKKLHS